jgi:hypothetical protein
MSDTENSWQLTISKISLVISFALLIFNLNSLVFGFIASFILNKMEYTTWILSQETWKILIGISLLIFILMSLSLYFADSWVNFRVQKIQKAVGKNLLLFLSLLLTICLLGINYYGFSLFFSFLYNLYWN